MLIKIFFTKIGKLFDSSLGKMGILLASLLLISLLVLPKLEGWSVSETLWWFPVTVTTVGYGDLAPSTLTGRIIGLLVMFGGIGGASVAVGSVISRLTERREQKMNGSGYYVKKGQIVIFGWIPGKTKSIINEIKADKTYDDIDIVLCADNIEENPLPNDIVFIKGRLSSQDVLERSHITHALKVVIFTNNDEQTVLITLAVDAANKNLNIVVYVQEEEYAEHIRRIDRLEQYGHISIIEPSSIGMIVQEMQDPGVANIIQSLLSNNSNRTIFRIPINKRLTYRNCISRTAVFDDMFVIGYEDKDNNILVFPEEETEHCKAIFVVASERPVLNV